MNPCEGLTFHRRADQVPRDHTNQLLHTTVRITLSGRTQTEEVICVARRIRAMCHEGMWGNRVGHGQLPVGYLAEEVVLVEDQLLKVVLLEELAEQDA